MRVMAGNTDDNLNYHDDCYQDDAEPTQIGPSTGTEIARGSPKPAKLA